jgi:hypothetical protein
MQTYAARSEEACTNPPQCRVSLAAVSEVEVGKGFKRKKRKRKEIQQIWREIDKTQHKGAYGGGGSPPKRRERVRTS